LDWVAGAEIDQLIKSEGVEEEIVMVLDPPVIDALVESVETAAS
jgi:hypothetical protein